MPRTLVSPPTTVDRLTGPPFACSCTTRGLDVAFVHVAGELDLATAPQLERLLREPRAQARLVVLDLRAIEFMDSFGVHTVVDASLAAQDAGRRLVVLRGRPGVDRLFELTATSDDIETVDLDPGLPVVQALLRITELDRLRHAASPQARAS